MTIILIAAGFFALGLTMVFLFRSAVNRDDELDRRWAEVVEQRAARGDPPSAADDVARPGSRGSEEAPVSGATPAAPETPATTPETPASPQPPGRPT